MSSDGGGVPDGEGVEVFDATSSGDEGSEDGFVYFRMSGGRFDAGQGMPASAASELQRYSELVYEVARLEWLRENPDRSAVRGLKDAFDLRLVAIEEGSARPVFKLRTRYDVRQTLADPEPLFVRARNIVNETIALVAVDGEVPPIFPPQAIGQLKRIGKSLQDGESIALAGPRPPGVKQDPTTDAVLTPSVSEVLKNIDETLAHEPVWAVAEGVVTELDGTRGTFRLDLTDGGVVECRLAAHERAIADIVKDVLAADGVTAPDVTVGGVGEFGRRGALKRLWDVSEVAIVRTPTEKALMARLSELGELQPNWWGPGTRGPGPVALRHAREVAPQLARATRRVAVGADGDGSIVLEWRNEGIACTVEIQADGDMYLFADDTDSGTHREYEGRFDSEAVVRFVETGAFDG